MIKNFSIEVLRGLSAIAVIFIHITASTVSESVKLNNYNFIFDQALLINSFIRFCVPIFVMISGMLLLQKRDDYHTIIQYRLPRILVPLLFWSLIYTIIKLVVKFSLKGEWEIVDASIDLFKAYPFYHLWYLFMVVGLYFLTPLLKYIIDLYGNKNAFKISIIFLLIGFCNQLFNHLNENTLFFGVLFFDYIGYYLMGYSIFFTRKLNNSFLFFCFAYQVF
ncbi:acyltransferase [Aquimarina agarivorans]|uniref:acyltransferase n=1 Tax=Aquimarina agarivorans TaxID=980584 RepID=UPI000248EB33|nr:acyltransferase family protein [Aquimarina agarivorans]